MSLKTSIESPFYILNIFYVEVWIVLLTNLSFSPVQTTEERFCPFSEPPFVSPLQPDPCGGGLTVRASYRNLRYRLAARSHAGVSVSLPQHVSQDLLSKRYKHLFTMEPASPRGPLNRNGRGRCCLISGLSKYMTWACVWVSACVCVCGSPRDSAWTWNFNQHLPTVTGGSCVRNLQRPLQVQTTTSVHACKRCSRPAVCLAQGRANFFFTHGS